MARPEVPGGLDPIAPEARLGPVLHVTSGDVAGGKLAQSGVGGEVLVWHDLLYDGPRKPGWPDEQTLHARAGFLEETTGGGLGRPYVLETLQEQYRRLESAAGRDRLVLWFDACLFDQAMLCHLLACLRLRGAAGVELLCVDAFPGIEPYHGLGQLAPEQFAAVYGRRRPVTEEQFRFAARVDRAFALQDVADLGFLSALPTAPLPWVPAAAARWLGERPAGPLGLGRLERLALEAVRAGRESPAEIFAAVGARDAPPRFWGDTTLWARINALADRQPPLVAIEGPGPRLPQWPGVADLSRFRVRPVVPSAVAEPG
ncbi:MAG: hypothetical protein ACYDA8_06025 [Deferrisomatales bacterium]